MSEKMHLIQKGDSNSKHFSFSEFYFNVSNKISSTPHPLLNLMFWSFKSSDCDFSGRFSLALEKALVKPKNIYPNSSFLVWIERIVADIHTLICLAEKKSFLPERCSLALASKSQRQDNVINQMGR